jgi:hypothetical protein
MKLEKFRLADGTIVKGLVNQKGWLEWVLRDKKEGVTNGISRPGSFQKLEKN